MTIQYFQLLLQAIFMSDYITILKFMSVKVKEQSFFSNNFILLNHIQVCFITIYDGCLT